MLWINLEDDMEATLDVQTAGLCTTLVRHKAKCEAADVSAPYTSAGQTLLAHTRDAGCHLLVMGCYGHSRLQEFILGGTSRYVLQQMTVPMLMAH